MLVRLSIASSSQALLSSVATRALLLLRPRLLLRPTLQHKRPLPPPQRSPSSPFPPRSSPALPLEKCADASAAVLFMLEVLALIPQALQVPCAETLLPLAAAALFPDVVGKYAAHLRICLCCTLST